MFSAHVLSQVAIAFTGVVAIFLTQSGRPAWARWACWFGLAGEPAWFYSAILAHQWGVFCLAFLYTFAWGKGIYTFWWLPYRQRKQRWTHYHDIQPRRAHRHDY